MDDIRTKITRDADRYYLQKLNCSFKFSFGPQAGCLEPRVPLYTTLFPTQSDSIIRGPRYMFWRYIPLQQGEDALLGRTLVSNLL